MARGIIIDGPFEGEEFRGCKILEISYGERKADHEYRCECARCGSIRWIQRKTLIKRKADARGCEVCRQKMPDEKKIVGKYQRKPEKKKEEAVEDARRYSPPGTQYHDKRSGYDYKVGVRGMLFRHNGYEWVRANKNRSELGI